MNESSKATQAASFAVESAEAWDWTASQLAELNRHLDKPFGEVERFNQALAFTLWMDGHEVEWQYGANGWILGANIAWNPVTRYRILPKPKVIVPPSIDWSHVQPIWKWLTQDKYETPLLFAEKPEVFGNHWGTGMRCVLGTHFASFKPGKGDWKKLIVQRPEGV